MLYVFLVLAAVLASAWAYSHFKVHAKLDAILSTPGQTIHVLPSDPPAPAVSPVVVNVHPAPTPAPVTAPVVVTLPAGVSIADATNGLVKIDAADAVFPGQLYSVAPSLPFFDPQSQAYATVAYNTAYGASADEGLGMHVRVNTMIAVASPTGLTGKFTNSVPYQWIPNAYTIGAEFDTWDKAIARAVVVATNLSKPPVNGNGAGFSPTPHRIVTPTSR